MRFSGVDLLQCIAMALPVVFFSVGCSEPDQMVTFAGAAQGTSYHVTFWNQKDSDVAIIKAQVDQRLAEIDQNLSSYRDDSSIERFNAQQTLRPVEVGQEIVQLVEAARSISEASHGCYDITIKPLFDLWGFNGDTLNLPDAETLTKTLEKHSFEKLLVTGTTSLQKLQPELKVDLSSIAQGYSVGEIGKLLRAAGIDNYLAELGGELETHGKKQHQQPWRVAVEKPLPGERQLQKIITMQDTQANSVMTSGTYRHYFDQNGHRYSHILDARTGRPVAHQSVSVTVIYRDPTLADAWSTALLCMGSREGLAVANAHHIAALYIDEVGNQMVEKASDAWQSSQTFTVE